MTQKVIYITGHIDLHEFDSETILYKLKELFIKINYSNSNYQILLGCQSKGADKIVRKFLSGYPNSNIKDLKIHNDNSPLSESEYYHNQAVESLKITNILVALWDGNFTYKPGGTSEIVRLALEMQQQIKIFHLVTPRASNLFPVHNLNEQIIDFNNEKFNRIPFAVNYSWVSFENSIQKELNIERIHSNAYKQKTKRQFFWRYLFPILLVLTTLILGSIGFYQYDRQSGIQNSIFNAANLLTLNSSYIESPDQTPSVLLVARWLGLIFVIYAFIYAFYLALGSKLQFFKLKRWTKFLDFNIVIGLNNKSINLINDLSVNKGKRVVVLFQDDKNLYLKDLIINQNVIPLQGNLTSIELIKSIRFPKAREVYVLTDNENTNIRVLQELGALFTFDYKPKPDYFVNISDSLKRRFLYDSLSAELSSRTSLFSINSNIVRKLLLLYPVDRFHTNPEVKTLNIIILGFSDLSEELLLTIFKQGHYNLDRTVEIDIICRDHKAKEKAFYDKYPTLEIVRSNRGTIVESYTWQNFKLRFTELDTAPSKIMENDIVFKYIKLKSIVTIYCSFDVDYYLPSTLNLILPKVNALKNAECDLKIFVNFSVSTRKEEEKIEKYFNALSPNISIKSFGNLEDSCSAHAIQNMALDALPKIINASYSNVNILDKFNINMAWHKLSEKDKDSSRQAADHLWVKLRLAWPIVNWKFDSNTFELEREVQSAIYNDTFLTEYSEIEHRRWCAELLLKGFVPITEDVNSQKYYNIASSWSDPSFKHEKKRYQLELEHIDLVPFDDLLQAEIDKDTQQLKNIPRYIRALIT